MTGRPQTHASAQKQAVALSSMAASSALTLLKFVAAFWTGSLGVLSEAIHSLLDVGATIITFMAVRVSDLPADEDHHYGHTKVETMAALAETGLLFVTSAWIIYEAVTRLTTGHNDVDVHPVALGIMIVSIAVDFFRARILTRIAKETRSQALEADALHFSSDMWSSGVVLIGLVLVWIGWQMADAFAAIIVSGFVVHAAWQLGQSTLGSLLDTAPIGVAEKLTAIAERIVGVVAIERVRVRPAGSVLFAEIEIAVSRTRPLDEIDIIKQDLVAAAKEQMPEVEVSVIAMPRALDTETVHDRVMVISRNRALAVHHLTVQQISGQTLAVSLDLEVDGRLPLVEAHAIATNLENAIAQELGGGVEVETHIEPLLDNQLAGTPLSPNDTNGILDVLSSAAAASGGVIRDVHNVRARATEEGTIVNFHCKVPPTMSVYDVHVAIDDLERAVRAARPDLRRAVGHAEPYGIVHPDRAPELQIAE
jgi:cation diffusion facilitator family transporter